MLKSLINRFVKAALDEFFTNAPSINLSLGSDLFSDTKVNLANLALRSDIFDVMCQPFVLIAGHVGGLSIEGIAEFALGGQLKFHAEDIFLLFVLDSSPDPEKVQTMKKILIELQSGRFSSFLLTDLLRRIQGLPSLPENDIKGKRRTLYKMFDTFSKAIFFTVKNIHVRIEAKSPTVSAKSSSLVNAVGFTIPYIRVIPAPSSFLSSFDEINKQDPIFLISVKQFSFYCDYNKESYRNKDDSFEEVVASFKSKWGVDIHFPILSVADGEIVIALGIKRRTGLVCPKVQLNISKVRTTIDNKQVEVINGLVTSMCFVSKKIQQSVRIQKIFRSGFPLPKISEVGGVKLLPHLLIRGKQYPLAYHHLPTSVSDGRGTGLLAFMKERVGDRWTIMLWKHLFRMIVADIQKVKPFGRWMELVRLTKIRREYSFLYSRLLKVRVYWFGLYLSFFRGW
jgi:hypothetical protein